MADSSITQTSVPGRSSLSIAGPLLFVAIATTSTLTVRADGERPGNGPRISVTCQTQLDASPGTLLCCLRDHNLTLSNFRYAVGRDESAFVIDSDDGSIRVFAESQTDAAIREEMRLWIIADEVLAEQDEFLKQFSAGLVEEGVSTDAVKSLSTSTVLFEITVQFIGAPQVPILHDSQFLVQMNDDAVMELGEVSVAGQQSESDQFSYYVVSGNEDGAFEIDAATGAISLRGALARGPEILSSHELVVLVENSAGLSSQASVFVTVINETPYVGLGSEQSQAQATETVSYATSNLNTQLQVDKDDLPFELPFGTAWNSRHSLTERSSLPRELVEMPVAGSESRLSPADGNPIAAEVRDIFVSEGDVESKNAILNTDRIDVEEVRDWTSQPSYQAEVQQPLVAIAQENSNGTDASLELPKSPQSTIRSFAILLVLLTCSVAAVVSWLRAAAARRAVLEDEANAEAVRRTETLMLLLEDSSGQEKEPQDGKLHEEKPQEEVPKTEDTSLSETEPVEATVESNTEIHAATKEVSDLKLALAEAVEKLDGMTEQVRRLEESLAGRDQTIEKLKAKLMEVCQSFAKPVPNEADPEFGIDADSWDEGGARNIGGSRALEVLKRPSDRNDLADPGRVPASVHDAAAAMAQAREKLGRQLHQFSLDPDVRAEHLTNAPTGCAVADSDEIESLRSEFAGLYELQRKLAEEATASVRTSNDTVAENAGNEAQEDSESTHIDSVKNYLSDLLSRSKGAGSAEAIFVNRRQSEEQFRGKDRREISLPPQRKPVVSFLDSYMKTHGGELAGSSANAVAPVEEPGVTIPVEPAKQRVPIDVTSIRESMDSFRAVAIQSVENAVFTYNLRQAKVKIALRSLLIAALVIVTAIVVVANMVHAIQFSMLSWMMVAAVLLAIAELCLRVQTIRKHRKSTKAPSVEKTPVKRPGRFSKVE